MTGLIAHARQAFHERLIRLGVLSLSDVGIASNADGSQKSSTTIALSICNQLNVPVGGTKKSGQTQGNIFESIVADFVEETFPFLGSIRPGHWSVRNLGSSRRGNSIATYEPYRHLEELGRAVRADPTLSTVLGNSYDISPDVIVLRAPEADWIINEDQDIVDDETALLTPMRLHNQQHNLIHALVSCKWTLRSDRAQNARSEALNIIRNRKGRTPHIAVVTAEPSPSRLASLALGTGDIDMVYHFALPELLVGVQATGNDEAISMLDVLLRGSRLRDISDLPLDLAV